MPASRPSAELAQDVAELFSQGYTRQHAASRLGVSKDTVEKAINRTCKAEQRAHEAQRARFAAARAGAEPGNEREAG
jgi:orotate phosphoribosyltransferase-like protein